ncbi:MAG: nucleotidyltransferase domain-containing protein [Caldilineaceae bacterium]
MYKLKDLPGTLQHQRILHSILSYYENDPRILAITVFGSLGRGNWDCYSDLDLDVVIADDIKIDIAAELIQLGASFAAIHEQIALLIPAADDADVVFKSLMELSIRYHPLVNTSPTIVDSMLLLLGRIDRSTIEAAGIANQKLKDEPLSRELDRCIRYALEVDSALHRGYLWSAIELLHDMRYNIMKLFTYSHQGNRPYQFFQKEADQKMQVRLGGTLPRYDLKTAQESLSQFMAILTNDLAQLTDGQVQLTKAHSELLTAIRSRQNDLEF